jgi:hypothetical protein
MNFECARRGGLFRCAFSKYPAALDVAAGRAYSFLAIQKGRSNPQLS